MPLMEWNETLDVGVQKMNDEHKDILSLMNRLYDCKSANKSGQEVIALVQELGRVTTAHFVDEEAYMESISYANLPSHKLIHKDLLTKYTGYAQKIQQANGALPDDFFVFLKLWLTAHIKGIDMKYGPKAPSMSRAS